MSDDSAISGADDPPAGAPAETIIDAIKALNVTMDGFSCQVAREHDRAKARETVIDRLHQENQVLRAGEARAFLRPVLTDLRQLRDDLLAQSRSVPAEVPAGQVTELLASYADSVAIILERYGVVAVSPQPRDPFDPRLHRAAAATATSEAELDGLIATVQRDGYADALAGTVLVAATVTVYRHAGAPAPDAPATGAPAPDNQDG